ncbi:MAG: universal stress protein [Okeania sp. SIO3I5]|uniref:universal stress protein n=1 Tax=Okeania sp. SIO3I5 TaxID=2607805 RepID=UPI0013BD29F1|nr:universal stress protein [Okeania sp. SIO3I5]NEQ39973.1 universal stress protein [Okeania sp. SIO3I5]
MFQTVLFPVNDSRETREAAEVVANIVQKYNSRLVLLAVRVGVSEGQETLTMNDHEAIAKLLEGAKAMFAQQGIEAEILEREGKPAFVTCDVADEIEANLIIIGSRGMGLTEEGVSDSVSNQIVNLSPCPVLVVP